MTAEATPQTATGDQSPRPYVGMFARLRSLLSDAAVFGMTKLLGQLAGFLLLPLYTRRLTAVEYGVIGMLSIISMLFGPVANLGMTTAIYRRLNQAADERAARVVLGTGLICVVVCSLFCFTVTMASADWIAARFVGDANTTGVVRLCLFSAVLATVAQVPIATLRARRRVKTIATINLTCLIGTILSTILFVAVWNMGVKGWVWGILVGDALFAAVAFALTWRQFELTVDRDARRALLSYGLPLVPHRLQAVALGQFSLYMVQKMVGLEDVGIYNVASRFALPVSLVIGAVQEAWIPYKFEVHAQESNPAPFFRSVFTYYIAGISYLWVGVSLWGFDVVRLMTAPEFHSAANLVPMLALLAVTQGVYYMLGTGVELSDRTGAYPLISLAGLITVVASAFLLVDRLGAMGAALANIAAYAVMAGAIFAVSNRRLKIPYDWPTLACLAFLAGLCVTETYNIQSQGFSTRLIWNVCVSLAYPLVAFVLLARSPAERERMSILLTRLRFSRQTS